MTVKGKFGSVDINDLAQNYMSLSKEQRISGRMEFNDVKFEGTFFFVLALLLVTSTFY